LDTAVGEQRHVSLPDGSRVDLAPDSRVSLRFSPLRREVRLERGQAYFSVAPGTLRPFIVQAGGLSATALGTGFDVRTGPAGTVVAVGAGRVRVAPVAGLSDKAESIDTAPVYAQMGQQVSFSPTARRLNVTALGPKEAGCWRRGILQFAGEPLPEVVAEVNRYLNHRIVLGPAARNARFTGTVAPQNIGEFLEALRQIYSVEVLKEDAHAAPIEPRAYPVAR
jgi:transmembrane sensor